MLYYCDIISAENGIIITTIRGAIIIKKKKAITGFSAPGILPELRVKGRSRSFGIFFSKTARAPYRFLRARLYYHHRYYLRRYFFLHKGVRAIKWSNPRQLFRPYVRSSGRV